MSEETNGDKNQIGDAVYVVCLGGKRKHLKPLAGLRGNNLSLMWLAVVREHSLLIYEVRLVAVYIQHRAIAVQGNNVQEISIFFPTKFSSVSELRPWSNKASLHYKPVLTIPI